jgi:uncharacterized membrane protein
MLSTVQKFKKTPSSRVNIENDKLLTLIDNLVYYIGNIRFIIIQLVLIVVWIIINDFLLEKIGVTPFDKYPYIFLNFVLALEASILAPLILLSQNRKSYIDTLRDNSDFEADLKSEKMIEQLLKEVQDLKVLVNQNNKTNE